MPIVLVAASLLLSAMVATHRQRVIGRENAAVVEASRSVLESMRNESFDQVVALYNADPLDDPGGPGTAPGQRFLVRGLTPLEDSPDGMIAEVILPMMDVSEDSLPQWELREDLVDARLGMPRDLNGDYIVDTLDHATDYRILPVLIAAEWRGRLGARRFRMFTLLTDYRL